MPLNHLHITTLEIASAQTAAEIERILILLKQDLALEEIVNYPCYHEARLIRPMVSFDNSAIALSFVPAPSEEVPNHCSVKHNDYTYHHLRRDLYDIVASSNHPIACRYIVPSAHVTIARFITQEGFLLENNTAEQRIMDVKIVSLLVKTIESINKGLKMKYWHADDESGPSNGEWIVGQDTGLELTKGRSWYGNGDKVLVGEGRK